MKPASKTLELRTEIELRERLRAEFDKLGARSLLVSNADDLKALAELLSQTTEMRKEAEKQEKELKAELRRHFPEGSSVLDCGEILAIIDRRSRTDLDRSALTHDLGTEIISRYERKTNYETLTLKRKI